MTFEAVDLVVVILAGCIATILLVASYNISVRLKELSPTRERIFTGILAGVLSALSVYVGARLEQQDPCCKLLENKGLVQMQPASAKDDLVRQIAQQIAREILERGAANLVEEGPELGDEEGPEL